MFNYKSLEDKITDKLQDLSIRTGVSYSVLYYNYKHREEIVKQIFPQYNDYKSRVMVNIYREIEHSYDIYKR